MEELDEDGNIIYEEDIKDDVDVDKLDIPTIYNPGHTKTVKYNPKSLLRTGASNDCIHRTGVRCSKLDKSISIDARDEKKEKCWERMFCDEYHKKED